MPCSIHAHAMRPRQLQAGESLGGQFLLMEIRADWPALSSTVGIPAYNSREGLCFRCSATLDTFRDLSPDAPWRNVRYTHGDFLRHVPKAARAPLWSIPGLQVTAIRHDWLHVMDEGVAKEFMGGALKVLVSSILMSMLSSRLPCQAHRLLCQVIAIMDF